MEFINTIENKKMAYICNNEYGYFMKKFQVIGVGIGYKITKGFYTSKKCITVFVIKKLPHKKILNKDLIPKFFKGYPTDVIECGTVPKVQSLTSKIRPTLGGYSIGNHLNPGSGTLGCLVSDKYLYILSNQHVFCISNIGPLESPILQPGVSDGGEAFENTIGHLNRFIPIRYINRVSTPKNRVDCALCKVINRSWVSPKIAFIGPPKGTAKATINENVLKVGKTSELTNGIVTNTNVSINVNIPYDKKALFIDQICTTKMTASGDSGSLLLNQNHYALGLIIGATDQMTIANSIDDVLNSLKVKLVTS